MSVFQTTLRKMVKGSINAHFQEEIKVDIHTLKSGTITINVSSEIYGMDLAMFMDKTKFNEFVSKLNEFQKTLDKGDK